MANADFSPKKEQTSPGGFDADSYREQKAADETPHYTPLQQKLVKLEAKLPPALASQAAAAVLCAVIVVVSAAGFGGGKLRGKYNEARQWYSAGVTADAGYNLQEELWTRANTAANILTTATNALGDSGAEVVTAKEALNVYQQALQAYEDGKGTLHAVCEYNDKLTDAVDALYSELQTALAGSSRASAVQSEYSKFANAQSIMNHLSYNTAVTDYQKATGGFPAVLLKPLFGIREVETFA